VEHHKKQQALLISSHESSMSTASQKVSDCSMINVLIRIAYVFAFQIQSLENDIANLKTAIEQLQCEVNNKAGCCAELQESLSMLVAVSLALHSYMVVNCFA